MDWREEYKSMKPLTKRQKELLDKGPTSLSSAWLLGAMHNDYNKIKGIKDPNESKENTGQLQSTLKEFFRAHP